MLPAFLPPMLARPGRPFDDERYLFEIKWDGCRMLCWVEQGRYGLRTRHGAEASGRYPEMAFLAGLPAGTLLDGEMVVLQQGKPDFALLQGRHQARSPLKIRSMSRTLPATYVVFDLLYEGFESLLQKPLRYRRDRLQDLVDAHPHANLMVSPGLVGHGRALYEQVCRQQLEGIMAKRLDSIYQPGTRSSTWLKIKPRRN